MPDDFYGPVSYSPLLLVIAWTAVAVALACAAWVAWRLLANRKPKPQVAKVLPAITPTPVRTDDIRGSYLTRIQQIGAGHQTGQLSDRQAHQQLSGAVRSFVSEVSGIPVNRFTLADLRAALATQPGLRPVADFVAELYSPSFAQNASREVADSVRDALEVVRRWN